MSKSLKIVLAVAAVVVVGIAGVLWFVNRNSDAPASVSLDQAASGVTAPPGTASGGTGGTGDLTGAWKVDTTTGTFDFTSATGSFVGFRVDEELASIGATTAVGRTGELEGTMQLEGTEVTATEVTADLSTITTNESRRDNAVRRALDTTTHPTTTFRLTAPIELGDAVTTGADVSAEATGELTVKGATKPVTFDLQARLVGSTIVVVGSTKVTLSDFGVAVPSAPIVVSAADEATVELQLLFVRG